MLSYTQTTKLRGGSFSTEIRQYFIDVVAPFAIERQNKQTEKEQLPEMSTLESGDILHIFLHDLFSFVRGKKPDEVG